MPQPIRILFVDDEIRLRKAWERLINAQPDMTLVGSLGAADDLDAAVDETSPDVVVIDLTMPGTDPIGAVRALAERKPDVKAVFYSGRGEPELMRDAFDAGAWGFIDKLTLPTDAIESLRRIAAGEVVFPGRPRAPRR